MQVPIDTLRSVMMGKLTNAGVPHEEAEVGVEMCIDAELRGHSSHGLRLVGNIVAEYTLAAPRRGEVRVLHESVSSARIDGGFHMSLYVHRLAVDLAIAKASETGLAIVSLANAGVAGALGYLVERMASNGLYAIAFNTTPVTVVAPGAGSPSLGTNPIAFGIPRRGAEPLILDMATSAIAFNRLRQFAAAGENLPEGVAVGADGVPTVDPLEATDAESGRARILPFGGHRGFGLSLMIELMTSAGVAGHAGPVKRRPGVMEPGDFASIYIAYQPGVVGDADAGATAIDDLVGDLTLQGVRIPGEKSRALRDERRTAGSLAVTDEVRDILGL
jgi:L-2-hydroxycarboxylate dehydrogenase (NAD+)